MTRRHAVAPTKIALGATRSFELSDDEALLPDR
jgi:hypothetical protein